MLYPILNLHTGNLVSDTIVRNIVPLNRRSGVNILLRWRNRFLYFALAQLRRSRVDVGVMGARCGGVQRGGDDAEATAESVGLPVAGSTLL